MIQILTSAPALLIYGMVIWFFVGIVFPGVNPVMRITVLSIRKALINRELVAIAANHITRKKSRIYWFTIRYLKRKLQ